MYQKPTQPRIYVGVKEYNIDTTTHVVYYVYEGRKSWVITNQKPYQLNIVKVI